MTIILEVILFSAKYHDDVIIIYSTCIEYVYDLFILLHLLFVYQTV
jgi:hypothetical protein